MTTALASQPISWHRSNDPEFPYEARWNGQALQVRLNDFPAEPLYTLIVDDQPVEDLDEWPAAWVRTAG